MMEMLGDMALSEALQLWRDPAKKWVESAKCISNTLEDLSKHMTQLGEFQFDRGGSLIFDANGEILDFGPMTIYNANDEAGYVPSNEPTILR